MSSTPNPADAFPETAIAVVGTACHLPGANNSEEFWQNLRNGIESTTFFSDEELLAAGIPAAKSEAPGYVKASPVLDGVAAFDPSFWGISPKDAAIMDPQHRHFLECAYEALEDAGHDSQRFDGTIGVFGGCGANSYLMFNLLTNPELVDSVGMFLLRHTSNDKDFLTTFTSYKMDLEGPSVGIQTACSTSLVAIHVAAQQLINGECDMALAGGSTIEIPHVTGYRYEQGEILSPDGHCRPFDAASQGTVFGSGAGMVVLRRLRDALADGDTIRAVLRGSAVNNDGSRKAGYLAPSVDGQAHAAAEAMAVAEVDADSLSYVETHGTGTPVGDPIEVAGLTQAFRETTDATAFCAIGSCKSNIGHVDTAAGVASLLKVVESLRHEELAPSLFFEKPNPLMELEASPFFVQAKLGAWPRGSKPRRASVNSLGVGGTNAHVILEEAPLQKGSASTRSVQVLPLSAKSPSALDAMCTRLADRLENDPSLDLADVAFTLQQGRRMFSHRRAFVVQNPDDAIQALRACKPPQMRQGKSCDGSSAKELAFLMPGGGAHYLTMARDIYARESSFRSTMDEGFTLLQSKHGLDLKPLLFAQDDAQAEAKLAQPSVQLPAIYLVEIALARLWMSWGIKPSALLGHSLGENSAACIAGVFSFEDGLGLVALRGQLFESLPPGGMLSVEMMASELEPLLQDGLVIGVNNAPNLQVVSGKPAPLLQLQQKLDGQGVECQAVAIACAAHSPSLDPILDSFRTYLKSIQLHPPQIPIVSNKSGTWMTDAEATSADYWVEHLRRPVRFEQGVGLLLQNPERVLLEVGPGKTLGSLSRQHPNAIAEHTILSSLRHREEKADDLDFLCGVLGQLWIAGITPDWAAFHGTDVRLRVPLPTYPFERKEYWIEPGIGRAQQTAEPSAFRRLDSIDDWFTQCSWRGVPRPSATQNALAEKQRWLLFLDRHGFGTALAARLREAGQEVITVREGDTFYRFADQEFALSPESGRVDYDALIGTLASEERLPQRIVHCWAISGAMEARPGSSMFHHNEERGFFSLFFLAQALGELDQQPNMQLDVISNGVHKVHPDDCVQAEKALLLGPVRVMPREYAFLETRSIDIDNLSGEGLPSAEQVDHLQNLLLSPLADHMLASRKGQVFTPCAEALELAPMEDAQPVLAQQGVVLITGGLGGLGLTIATHFAKQAKAKLVLIGRSSFPPAAEWDAWLETHTESDRTCRRIHRLRAMQEMGAEILVLQADVANLEDMRNMLRVAKQRFGQIDGVIHAAGVLEDGVIQMRTPEAIERVFTPKVHGTVVLHNLLQQEKLRFFVLCSSTSVALGPAGQVDYVAANAFLNAYASAQAEDAPNRMIALNWGIWSDVGMAQELAARLHGAEKESGERQRIDTPWFQERLLVSEREQIWRGHLDARSCWALEEHRLQSGLAVLPGTAYLDLALSAYRDWKGHAAVTLEDVQFLTACEVPDDAPREISIGIKSSGVDFNFEVRSRDVETKDSWLLHTTGRIHSCIADEPEQQDIAEWKKQADKEVQEVQQGSLPDPQERYLAFGPRFRTHQYIGYGTDFAYARLQLPQEFADDLAQYPLHPAMLDIGTGCAMELLQNYNPADSMFVPIRYQRLEFYAPLTSEMHCHLMAHPGSDASQELVSFDIKLCDSDGKMLVTIQGLQLRRLSHNNRFANATVKPKRARNTDSPAERAFLDSLTAGIDAKSGMQALERVLHSQTPAVLTVSSMDLKQLHVIQDQAMAQLESKPGVKFQRPNLSSAYSKPADAIEQQLADWWEDLLGVEKVGAEDDFFEVGGHSLVAVRLFARIKKKWQLEYPLSFLFEAPTIRLCADMLRAELNAAAEDEDEGNKGAASLRAQGTPSRYLVPLNDVRKGSKPPFFLVAGMFGNVLNLRHLAAHLGKDQPMYAVQARGLHGDDRPHRRFEDMARDYLEEIRKVQPEGPYLLGGFSGGGITAMEMAQQLQASGEETAALILLDTPITHAPTANFLQRILILGMRIKRGGLGYLWEWPRKRLAWERLRRQQQESPAERDLAPAEFRSEMIQNGFLEALEHYKLHPYSGRITLFRPPLNASFKLPGGVIADDYREIQDSNNHWGPYAKGGIDCFEVLGDHDSMVLEPHVRVLGGKVCQVLNQAQEDLSQNKHS
ncbi:MAG: SDR family NAD(P)-dependent oxidoreductase [Planctomycetota bacterium]